MSDSPPNLPPLPLHCDEAKGDHGGCTWSVDEACACDCVGCAAWWRQARHTCGTAWEISRGPGRIVGPIARSITGVHVPLPDDFEFEYCPKCNQRNMTPELELRFLAIEKAAKDAVDVIPDAVMKALADASEPVLPVSPLRFKVACEHCEVRPASFCKGCLEELSAHAATYARLNEIGDRVLAIDDRRAPAKTNDEVIREIVEWLHGLERARESVAVGGSDPREAAIMMARRGVYEGVADDIRRKWGSR